jgi:hypothetical protein
VVGEGSGLVLTCDSEVIYSDGVGLWLLVEVLHNAVVDVVDLCVPECDVKIVVLVSIDVYFCFCWSVAYGKDVIVHHCDSRVPGGVVVVLQCVLLGLCLFMGELVVIGRLIVFWCMHFLDMTQECVISMGCVIAIRFSAFLPALGQLMLWLAAFWGGR